MKVPLIDLRGQHLSLRPQLIKAVESVIDSQQFVLGSEVEAFENKVAEYCSTEFAIGCASGSDALLLALMALDLKAGDVVLFGKYSGTEVKINNEDRLIMREDDVLAVVE